MLKKILIGLACVLFMSACKKEVEPIITDDGNQ